LARGLPHLEATLVVCCLVGRKAGATKAGPRSSASHHVLGVAMIHQFVKFQCMVVIFLSWILEIAMDLVY
jgi:hypothetical protein